MGDRRVPYSHPADEHFTMLVDYLRHLVDTHGVEETPGLWRSGRDRFDALHEEAHGVASSPPDDATTGPSGGGS